MAANFDTLHLYNELKGMGMETDDAERLTKGIALAIGETTQFRELATKRDLQDLRHDLKTEIQDFRLEVKDDFNNFRSEFNASFSEHREEMKSEMSNFRCDVKDEIWSMRESLAKMKGDIFEYVSNNNWKAIGILATFQTLTLSIFGLLQYFKVFG